MRDIPTKMISGLTRVCGDLWTKYPGCEFTLKLTISTDRDRDIDASGDATSPAGVAVASAGATFSAERDRRTRVEFEARFPAAPDAADVSSGN